PRADPGGRGNPRFWHRLISFRHFISGLLAFASLNRACRDLAPAFPQRSPPWYLATAACGGLRSAHDCRPRRALLHHSHSWASPVRRRRFRVTHPAADIVHPSILQCGIWLSSGVRSALVGQRAIGGQGATERRYAPLTLAGPFRWHEVFLG